MLKSRIFIQHFSSLHDKVTQMVSLGYLFGYQRKRSFIMC